MFEFDVLKKSTPVVYAEKINHSTARVPGKPLIYHKCFDFTEFIGEDLASIRNIRSAHYFPVCFGKKGTIYTISNLRVGSFDFYKEKITYKFCSEFDFIQDEESRSDYFSRLLERCPTEKNREELIDEVLELMALDTYMVQYDRSGNCIYEIHPNGEIHLAPIFDYEASLDMSAFDYDSNDFIDYSNDFFCLSNDDDYFDFMKMYPQFRDKLENYLDVCLTDRIKKVVKKRRFNSDAISFTHYELFDELSHKRIKKLIR